MAEQRRGARPGTFHRLSIRTRRRQQRKDSNHLTRVSQLVSELAMHLDLEGLSCAGARRRLTAGEGKFADTATRLMMNVPLSLRRSGLRWP